MWQFLKIASYVVVPLGWGLLVEYAFELLRRWRSARPGRAEPPTV